MVILVLFQDQGLAGCVAGGLAGLAGGVLPEHPPLLEQPFPLQSHFARLGLCSFDATDRRSDASARVETPTSKPAMAAEAMATFNLEVLSSQLLKAKTRFTQSDEHRQSQLETSNRQTRNEDRERLPLIGQRAGC